MKEIEEKYATPVLIFRNVNEHGDYWLTRYWFVQEETKGG
jgi:hypothetical protein